MSTVTEIEFALEKLPVDAQREVAAWLVAKLWPETPAMLAAIDEAERSLKTALCDYRGRKISPAQDRPGLSCESPRAAQN